VVPCPPAAIAASEKRPQRSTSDSAGDHRRPILADHARGARAGDRGDREATEKRLPATRKRPAATERSDRGDRKATGEATTGDPRSGIYESAMANEEWDVRCVACGKLLAKAKDGLLTIQRGDLCATFDGRFRASIVCGRPGCGQRNVVLVMSHDRASPAFDHQ